MTFDMSNPLKVICFLFDPNIGGPTIRARQVSHHLRDQCVEVIFALPNTNGTAKAFLKEGGFQVDDLQIEKPVLPNKLRAFLRFLFLMPISLIRLVRYLKRENPDVIHINGAFDILPALAGKLARVPVVWQLNDMLFGKRLSKVLGWWVGHIANVVAVTSKPVIGHYDVSSYNPIILPVPVDMTRYQPTQSKNADVLECALVGNWNPLKRIEDFVQVIHRLKLAGHPVRGHVFGKLLDSQTAYWEPIVDDIENKGLHDDIIIEGFTNDLPAALSTVDIVLITSQSEAGPLSCLEAMACAVPVVAYNVGDVIQMLDPSGAEPGGFVVEGGHVDGMVDACEALITDTALRAQMGKNARDRAGLLYSVQSVAPLTLSAYRRAGMKPAHNRHPI